MTDRPPATHDAGNALDWAKIDIPGRWHRCRPYATFHTRCRCGAYRVNADRWVNRNARLLAGASGRRFS